MQAPPSGSRLPPAHHQHPPRLCNTFTGACIYTSIPGCNANPQCKVQADCDDGDTCTVDYCNVAQGTCGYFKVPGCSPTACKTTADCDDKNNCTTNFCSTFTGNCIQVPLPGCKP